MRLAVIVPLVAALATAPALAADRSPPPQGGWERPTPEQMEAHHAAMEARRATDIAVLLGLRADQKPALDSFLAASRPHDMHGGHGPDGHGPDGGRDGHGPDGTMPPEEEGTLARLDHMSQRIDAHDAEAKQRIEATRRFYASLTPDQQKRFDAMSHLMHGHDGMGGHGGGHGDHGGDRGGMHPMG